MLRDAIDIIKTSEGEIHNHRSRLVWLRVRVASVSFLPQVHSLPRQPRQFQKSRVFLSNVQTSSFTWRWSISKACRQSKNPPSFESPKLFNFHNLLRLHLLLVGERSGSEARTGGLQTSSSEDRLHTSQVISLNVLSGSPNIERLNLTLLLLFTTGLSRLVAKVWRVAASTS